MAASLVPSAAPSDSGSAGARSARGPSTKTCSEVFEKINRGQDAQDQKEHISFVTKHVTEDPELFKTVRGVILKHLEKKRKEAIEKRLRRGVAKLDQVPKYLVCQALGAMTGLDLSVFTNLPEEDVFGLFYFGMKGTADYGLPQKNMTFSAFMQWVRQRYELVHSPLSMLHAEMERIDWEFQVGEFYFQVPDKVGPDTIIKIIGSRTHNRTISLEEGHMYEDIGTEVTIQQNYHYDDAYIFVDSTGLQQPISKIFEAASGTRRKSALKRNPPSATTPNSEPGSSAKGSGEVAVVTEAGAPDGTGIPEDLREPDEQPEKKAASSCRACRPTP